MTQQQHGGDDDTTEAKIQEALREALKNPESTAFSRLKYMARPARTREELTEFINGLFITAATGKDAGDYREMERFLLEWEDRMEAMLFANAPVPKGLASTPWAPVNKPVSGMRVALLNTGGIYVDGDMPFEPRADSSFRELPRTLRQDQVRVSHGGYDYSGVLEDVNCVLPVERFRELERQGVIGVLHETMYSFMGLIPDPAQLSAKTAPEVARRLKAAGVDAAFLAST